MVDLGGVMDPGASELCNHPRGMRSPRGHRFSHSHARSETSTEVRQLLFGRVASSLLTKRQGANEPRQPKKFLTATGTINVISEEEARRRCKNIEKWLAMILIKNFENSQISRSSIFTDRRTHSQILILKILYLPCGDGVLQSHGLGHDGEDQRSRKNKFHRNKKDRKNLVIKKH